MAKKPANLIYAVEDSPPHTTATLLGIQHVFVMTAGWVMVVVIATTIGAAHEQVTNVLRMSMIASGIGMILQCLCRRRSVPDIFVPSAADPPLFLHGFWRATLDSSQAIFDFMETQGGTWGARREVIQRAAAALNEFLETASAHGLVNGQLESAVSFDEFNLDVDIRYAGKLMQFPALRPPEAALLSGDAALASLSGFLIRGYDRPRAEALDGRCRIQLHFDQ